MSSNYIVPHGGSYIANTTIGGGRLTKGLCLLFWIFVIGLITYIGYLIYTGEIFALVGNAIMGDSNIGAAIGGIGSAVEETMNVANMATGGIKAGFDASMGIMTDAGEGIAGAFDEFLRRHSFCCFLDSLKELILSSS